MRKITGLYLRYKLFLYGEETYRILGIKKGTVAKLPCLNGEYEIFSDLRGIFWGEHEKSGF